MKRLLRILSILALVVSLSLGWLGQSQLAVAGPATPPSANWLLSAANSPRGGELKLCQDSEQKIDLNLVCDTEKIDTTEV